MSWTDERIERLTKMWEGGATASQIAEELGGVSRNAVIGKAHRLGLKARPSPVKANDVKPADVKSTDRPDSAASPEAKQVKSAEALVVAPVPDAPVAPRAPAAAPPAAATAPSASTAANTPRTPQAGAPATGEEAAPVKPPSPRIVSVGPGGFLRQGPGDQQAPIPPAPPRRLVAARPAPEIADKTGLLDLNDRICRWPMGHPGEADFHFCGVKVNPGFPYCVEHCGRAYQAQLPRGHRRPPPPLPFGGPRVR